ncbi:MAG: pyridoxal 5'-phosphate synthase glutaminase subunit PdxT [Ilumatobacter sp.]
MSTTTPKVGVLALQGAFAVHQQRLVELDVEAPAVRTAEQLDEVDALVIPGGESTTMSHLMRTNDLFDPIDERIRAGMAVFGTCAGMIMCASEVLDGRSDQRSFGAIDLTVRRNGYGRQLASFEADICVEGIGADFHAVFIRAPLAERHGPDVEVLAAHEGVPVLLRQGRCTVASFHPELTPDGRLHRLFVDSL